jgi:hypothetical protein
MRLTAAEYSPVQRSLHASSAIYATRAWKPAVCGSGLLESLALFASANHERRSCVAQRGIERARWAGSYHGAKVQAPTRTGFQGCHTASRMRYTGVVGQYAHWRHCMCCTALSRKRCRSDTDNRVDQTTADRVTAQSTLDICGASSVLPGKTPRTHS